MSNVVDDPKPVVRLDQIGGVKQRGVQGRTMLQWGHGGEAVEGAGPR
jgi:hypothetical protein